MDQAVISIVIVVLFTFIVLSIGMFGWAKKMDTSAQDYFVASRTLGFAALFFTYTATYHSASAFLGTGGFLYAHGISYWAIGPYTQTIGGILLYLFGSRIWLLGKKYNYYTPGDLLGAFYESKFLKVLTGIVLAAFVIPYVQLQLAGAGWITEFVTFGAVPYVWGATGLGLVVLLYVYLGGMRSVAWTDIFMGVFMFFAIVVGGWYLTNILLGGPTQAWLTIEDRTPLQLVLPGAPGYFTLPMAFSWTVIITIGLSVAAPHVIMRMFSATSIRILKWVAVLSPIFLVWIYISYVWFGMGTRALYPGIEFPDEILPRFLFEHTPVVFAALICAGGLAAMLSTANSQLHASGALLSRDVYNTINKNAGEKQLVTVGRVAILIIFVFSAFAAIQKPPLLAMLIALATGGMAQIFPMLFGALFWPRATKAGAISGFIVGTIIMVWFELGGINLFGMMPGFWALAANTIVFVVVSYSTRPQSAHIIKKFHGFLDSEEAKNMLKL
ncbi:sodium:solute symporter family protein [Alteribacter natronophilus]|uniref:sodium:solute symporter family protein n=1 Tax=Alteribacter natronophilus TaxID=2583810 RepID=UPI00110EFC12|nr:sodium:solute symporter family protein [Alteribacter natronophilus]TMW71186.1 sodium:solute symporter family protein [Alteribacter natronophilus]